jgi:ComF family protein
MENQLKQIFLSTRAMIKKLGHLMADCLFPIYCANCHNFLPSHEKSYLCLKCFSQIPLYSSLFCPICLKRLAEFKKCEHSHKKSYLDFLASATDYENPIIKNLIHQYKYQYIKEIRFTLAKILIAYWEKILKNFPQLSANYLAIPIPLSSKKFNERGFNQSEEIAQLFANHFNLEIVSDALIRIKNNPPQAKIENYEERTQNVKGIFLVKKPELIQNKNIILIDDVFTSGATLQEASRLLKESGAKRIVGLTIAK